MFSASQSGSSLFSFFFLQLLIQNLDVSNWKEEEKECEVQQISIAPLQCEQSNITSCLDNLTLSDNFTLTYKGENITLSLNATNSSVLEEKLNQLQAFQGLGTINVTLVNVTEPGNATVFQISFCLADPRGVEVLNGTVANEQALSLHVTRLVQGKSAKDFQLVFDQPDLPSASLTPNANTNSIRGVLKDWLSTKCEVVPSRLSK